MASAIASADVADRLLLHVPNRKRLGVKVTNAVVSVQRTGSMEAKPAVVLTLQDPDAELANSENLTKPKVRPLGSPAASTLREVDLELDGHVYRLAVLHRTGDGMTELTFRHRGAALMGTLDDPMSASRGKTTRALFIRRQVMEVAAKFGADHGMGFYAFRPGHAMPSQVDASSLSKRAEPKRDPTTARDRAKQGKGLKLGGQTVDREQRWNIAVALQVAENDGAGRKATLALVEACIVEAPNFTNPIGGDGTSSGILQLLSSHLHGSISTRNGRRDVALVCHLFLTQGFTGRGGAIRLAAQYPQWSAGQVAQAVQGSAFPGRYDDHRREAENVLAAFGGIGLVRGEGGSYAKPHVFKRKKGEDGWANTGSLAEEVGFRRFVTFPAPGSDLFVYAADEDLLGLRAQATIDVGADYVLSEPEWELDSGRTVKSATLSVRGDAFDDDLVWGVPVVLKGAGAADGRWLVWDVQETDGTREVQLELRQPERTKPEPADEIVQRADGGLIVVNGSGVDAVYAAAIAISRRNLPYVWGGGHATAGRPDRGTGRDPGVGFDCSGYVSAILDAGGMLPGHTPRVSGAFESWGEAGPGKTMTVWCNGGHIFVQFRGRKYRWADTSTQAGGPSGPHVRTGNRSTAGFVARHWKGT